MHKRGVRVALLALLIVVTSVAALIVRNADSRADDLLAARDDVDARLARLNDTFAAIGAAQQSYIAPGQAEQPWFERMSGLVRQAYDDTATLTPLLRSEGAATALKLLAAGMEALLGADARARENLRLGQPLMAADVIFSDSRNTLDAMSTTLRDLRTAEHAAYDAERAGLSQGRWLALGLTAVLLIVAIVLLVPVPTTRTEEAISPSEPAHATPTVPQEARPLAVDLVAAAHVCTALSRLTDTAELPGVLSRAAGVLHAPGIILWMGAGEELFAVTAHGYRPQMIAKLGPIPRTAENATAAAWRSGELTTVAGDEHGHGAIVAPMFGPDACIGVLAIEAREGREQDPAMKAVAAMIAAQLATAVSAWPAASPAQAPLEVARQLAREFRTAGSAGI